MRCEFYLALITTEHVAYDVIKYYPITFKTDFDLTERIRFITLRRKNISIVVVQYYIHLYL